MARALLFFLISTITLAIGCKKPPSQPDSIAPRLAASKLSILVVDDPPLAASIKLLRGEWNERTGGQLEIEAGTVEQLLAAAELSADLVIYPSRFVGTLVDRQWLRPVRKSVLESADVAINDLFPLVRNATLPYGGQVYALTLGEPPLMLMDWGDIGQKDIGQKGWNALDNPSTSQNSQLRYPHAVALLARGVSYGHYRSGSTGWFDAETMQPRIAEPPYVKALREIIENVRVSTKAKADVSIGWPTTGATKSPRYSSFPLADEVYNPLREIWVQREEDKSLAFLGFSGRSASVAKSTRNSASAFKLLKWLVSEKIATQISPRSEATVWFRKSQMAKAKRWLPKGGANDETAANISKLLSSSDFFLLPRIPGVDEYMQTLEEAILQAISKDLPSAEESLAGVVEEWNTLTDRYGRDRQLVAYRKHLGLHVE